MNQGSCSGRDDAGYALIATLWLLLLSGSVAGLLMMRAVETSKASATQRALLLKTATDESALQTAAADLLLNGAASRFGTLPSIATYQINGQSISVAASLESERLDINVASPEYIDSQLRNAGVNAQVRATLLRRLSSDRAIGKRTDSNAAIASLVGASCASNGLTAHGGRRSVSPSFDGAGDAVSGPASNTWRLRVEGSGGGRTIVARPGAAGQQPVLIFETGMSSRCDGML